MRGIAAGLDRSPRPVRRRRCALRCGFSGAGSAPARSRIARSLAVWVVKLPVIWPEPPRIGSLDHGRGDHLLVQHDGEAVADIVLGDVAELARAHAVEAEIHDRRCRLRDRSPARHRSAGRPTPSRAAAPRSAGRLAGRLGHLAAGSRRRSACHCSRPLDRRSRPPAGRSSWRSCPGCPSGLRIRQARHLHQDAVVARRSMVGSRVPSSSMRRRTTSIDWSIDLLLVRVLIGVGHVQRETPPPGSVMSYCLRAHRQHEPVMAGLRSAAACLRFGECAQARCTRTETRVALALEIGDSAICALRKAARMSPISVSAVLLHLVEIHLQQQIGTALQVQAQIDRAAGQHRPEAAAHVVAAARWAARSGCRPPR